MNPAPYPADTRAKGWRFELDHERIRQSDTWALASPEIRPWLLMLWMVAWEQTPCGSLPADPELIAARIGMPRKAFDKCRAVLLRGWQEASDGRLYHAVVSERVSEMVEYREKAAVRKAEYRAKMQESHTSPAVVPRDSTVQNDTGTGTGTGTLKEKEIAESPLRADPPSLPPDFDGSNAEALNGRHVVAIAKVWELPNEWGSDAEALGWKPREVLLEAEKFRQHWTAGKGAGKRRSVKGWRQSWSNWLAIAAEKRR